MRKGIVAIMMIAALAAVVEAHITVTPAQSTASAEQRYTIRVPTEGQVATTAVELEVPAGVTVTEVVAGNDYTFDVRREAGRIVAITWKKEIPPRATGQFAFVARNPASGQLAWKARQRMADGTSIDWIGVAGDRRPASVTRLTAAR